MEPYLYSRSILICRREGRLSYYRAQHQECCFSVTNLICVPIIGLAGLNARKQTETGCLRQRDGCAMTARNNKNFSQRHCPRLPFSHFTAYIPSFNHLWLRHRVFRASMARPGRGGGLQGSNPAPPSEVKRKKQTIL